MRPSCSIEIADNQAATWNATAVRFNVLKLETIARMAKDRAVAAGTTLGAVSLWSDAFQKASHARDACMEASSVCRTGYEIAPKQLKESWIKEIQWSEDRRLLCSMKALRCKARMEAYATNSAIEQAMTSPDADAIVYWKRSFQEASKTAITCAELVDACEPNLAMASEEDVVRGLQNIEKAEHQRAFWIAKREWCKTQGTICKARLAIDRAMTAPSLEAPLHWEEALLQIQKTETALAQLLLFCRQSAAKIHQGLHASWRASMEALQDEKAHWSVKRHSSIAQREAFLARNIIDRLEVLTPAELPPCLNEAIAHVTTARDRWGQIEENCRQNQTQAPQQFQELWGQKLKEAQRQRVCWDAMLPWLEMKQAWAQHDLSTQEK